MHKTLIHELQQLIGADDGEKRNGFLRALAKLAADQPIPVERADALAGFSEFVERISLTYAQYDHDLAEANTRLQAERASHENSKMRLRQMARSLRAEASVDAPGHDAEDLDGLIDTIAGLLRDREGNQKATRLAQRALENQKFALDQHAIVSITDPQGIITYANDRFCQISGYSRQELTGANHRLVKSGCHPPEFFRALWQTISAGQVWAGEVQNRAKDGSLYWVAATIVPFLDEEQRPYQYVAIRTDITARYRVAENLREQLHFIEELIEAIPLPVYVKDEDRRYHVLNRAFEEYFGIARADYLNKTVFDLLCPESAEVHDAQDRELLKTVGRRSYEAKIPRRDGLVRDGIYHKATLTRPDGSIAGLVGTIADITEHKAWELQTVMAKDAAEAANRAKSDFLANMSHEIRTPINGILGMTDLALDTELSAEQRDYLRIVKTSANALLTVINDILDFSRIETGKMTIEETSFDLREVVAAALKNVTAQAQDKGLKFACAISPEIPSALVGDPGRLRQVLLNLISNAIKFTERGEVVVRIDRGVAQETGDGIVLRFTVSDTGIGIAREKQAAIFEAFSQGDGSATRKFGGTGLGLSISTRLVSMMNGRLWFESDAGQGSTFQFTLPFRSVPRGARAPAAGFDYAAALAAQDREILEIVTEPFVESFPTDLSTMRDALARGDLVVLQRTAHSLKGTCGLFGATPMVAIARTIEHYEPAGDSGLPIDALIATLAEDFERLNTALRAMFD